jgi:hypothetical protein
MRWQLSFLTSILLAATAVSSHPIQPLETKPPSKKVDYAELKIRRAIQRKNVERKREIRAGWKWMQARELASWLVTPEVQLLRSVGVRISGQREYASDLEIDCFLFRLWIGSDPFRSFQTYFRIGGDGF